MTDTKNDTTTQPTDDTATTPVQPEDQSTVANDAPAQPAVENASSDTAGDAAKSGDNADDASGEKKQSASVTPASAEDKPQRRKRSSRRGPGGRRKEKKEFEERLLEVRRVTRVTTGWRQLAFRAVMILWNKKGKIGIGIGKSGDVLGAIQKATRDAKKHMVNVPVTETQSVPYAIMHKYKAAKIKLIPAGPGTGLKAGSSVRSVLELAGYSNILSKIVGTNNKLANAIATINALQSFKV